MVRILYGHSGSGKSRRIYDLLKKDALENKRSYLIVPEQQTVQCERLMLDLLPPSAQLTCDVLNFSRLANLVFRNYGGLSYNYADKGAKTLIMWKNLKELSPFLTDLPDVSGKFGTSFAKEMLSAVSELKAYCVSPAKLENAASKVSGNALLKSKMMNLALICEAYTNHLSESYSDSSDDLTKLTDKLKNHDFFKDANVYIDSFTSFTLQEYAVIEQIIKGADEVTFALTLDKISSKQIHYESTADTAMRIRQMTSKASLELKEEYFENSNSDILPLETIKESLWNPEVLNVDIPQKDEKSLRIIQTSDPYEEAFAVANTVKSLMMSGMRCKDIVIVARDASLYRGVLDTALEKSDIPYFFSQSTDIMSKAPIKFIISALRIKIYNWRKEDVIAYLKTDLCGFDRHSVDLFECYVSLWNIRGNSFTKGDFTMNPKGYSETFAEHDKETLREVNDLKNAFVPALMKFFTELDAAENAKEMCVTVYKFLEENHVGEILLESSQNEYAKGKRKEAAELLQLYNAEIKALENLCVILSDEEISVKEFVDSLKIMLGETCVNTIPTAKDQVVVGSASMLRANDVKCAILIGLNEGEFPQTVKDSGLFSDSDKKILSSVGISLSADSFIKSSDELFYVYRAMSAPKEKLFAFYHASDFSGAKTNYSMAIDRLMKLFPKLQIENYADFAPNDIIISKSIAKESISKIKDERYKNAVIRYFKDCKDSLYAESASHIQNKYCNLSEETYDSIYGDTVYLTQTVMEKYVGCPFSYMCERLFNVNTNEKASFNYMNFGTYVHYILENYLRQAKKDGMIGKAPCDDYIKSWVDHYAYEYFNKLSASDSEENHRLQHRFMRMRKLAILVAKSITREFSESKFTPEFFELSIGRKSQGEISLAPIVIERSQNKKVSLSGIADRVDAYHSGDDVYLRVIDYKTGEKTFSKGDIEKGENLQLPLYLFSLCDDRQTLLKRLLGSPKGRILPAGAMYVSSKISPIEVLGEKDEGIYEKAEDQIKHSGFILNDEEVLKGMNSNFSSQYLCGVKPLKKGGFSGNALTSLEEMDEMSNALREKIVSIADSMANGKMSTSPSEKACEHCTFKNICRNPSKEHKKY